MNLLCPIRYQCNEYIPPINEVGWGRSFEEIVQVFLKSGPFYEEGKLSFQTLVKVLNGCHLPASLATWSLGCRSKNATVFRERKMVNPTLVITKKFPPKLLLIFSAYLLISIIILIVSKHRMPSGLKGKDLYEIKYLNYYLISSF